MTPVLGGGDRVGPAVGDVTVLEMCGVRDDVDVIHGLCTASPTHHTHSRGFPVPLAIYRSQIGNSHTCHVTDDRWRSDDPLIRPTFWVCIPT